MAKRKPPPSGAPLWMVTFADLLATVLAFFVILAAYSTMDKKKMQVVAGSMHEAFGTVKESRFAGIMELDGIPTKPRLANARVRPIDEAVEITAPNERDSVIDGLLPTKTSRAVAMAATSLRQALSDMPEIAQLSKNIVIDETKEGLNLSLVDQDGRSMFAEGSTSPLERTRRVLEAVAPTLRRLPNRIAISGHTSGARPGQRLAASGWEISTARASTIRELLAASGVPDGRFASVTGKADTEPLFPDNPYLAANRRVTITILTEAPAMPAGLKP
jgi:chemotaxis protein MotB